MIQTLDGDKRIMPVDMLMIVQMALCLNIMVVVPYCMRQYKLHEGFIVSLLTCYSGHAGTHSKMNGRKSLGACLGLKSGV